MENARKQAGRKSNDFPRVAHRRANEPPKRHMAPANIITGIMKEGEEATHRSMSILCPIN